ncbi:MAG: hypothetical protein ABL933_05895 [Methyloglobulus sp.]|nr:hypothetical protein [Methyloglobulus sp.]
MKSQQHYLKDQTQQNAAAVVKGIDQDVEWGEDILMLGLGIVMLSSTFAPVAPPTIILPLVALTFAITSSLARRNYHNIERKLSDSMKYLNSYEQAKLRPICQVFVDQPMGSLAESYNPLKNLKRLAKSAIGGILINPFWLPIFYTMGIQIIEEINLGVLNRAVMRVEQKLSPNSNFNRES